MGVARERVTSDSRGVNEPSLSVGWTTTSTRDDALRLGRSLVDAGLVACAQVSGPITSIYRWEGRIESTEEFRLTLKFRTSGADAIVKWLNDNHPYDIPQWVFCRIDGGSEKYLKWVEDNSSYPPLTEA